MLWLLLSWREQLRLPPVDVHVCRRVANLLLFVVVLVVVVVAAAAAAAAAGVPATRGQPCSS